MNCAILVADDTIVRPSQDDPSYQSHHTLLWGPQGGESEIANVTIEEKKVYKGLDFVILPLDD